MFPINAVNRSATRLALLALLLLTVFAASARSIGAAPVVQDTPAVGHIGAIGLDARGDGWAWAEPAQAHPNSSFLLRIVNSAYRIYTDPLVLMPPPGVNISGIKLNAAGTDGWATGTVVNNNDGSTTPLLWRLVDGSWQSAIAKLPTKTLPYKLSGLYSLTLSDDGTEGWMTATTDSPNGNFVLYHLSSGIWNWVELHSDVSIFDVAISPDGKHGYGWGLSNVVEGSNSGFELVNGVWQPLPTEIFQPSHTADEFAVDNTGRGWVLASHFRDGVGQSLLYALNPGASPTAVALQPNIPNLDRDAIQVVHRMAVGSTGRGVLLGRVDVSDGIVPGATRSTPVAYSVDGRTVTAVPLSAYGLKDDMVLKSDNLVTSPGGAHTWLAWHDDNNMGRLTELHDLWQHDTPAAAAPLVGNGKCFAESKYCLRGLFASFWESHGGLDQLGYPLTPEVQERIGAATYTVQYTQRARLEWHPEYQGTPSEVLLGLLGNTIVNSRLNEASFKPAQKVTSFDVQWFPQTMHNIATPILPYWQGKGGVPVFGLPRSEAFEEKNTADGKTYLVQYFERNRIEFHPENRGTAFEFQLGLLGVEQFNNTYGYTP